MRLADGLPADTVVMCSHEIHDEFGAARTGPQVAVAWCNINHDELLFMCRACAGGCCTRFG